ncbi:MAG TPA: MarC family protein [Candidatus Acidoferrales bacterium]|nr:MarC family protein [Candidatus Acidoferrales bacterium]
MRQEVTLFVGMFTTLLAIINPLEALPVFLKLLEGKSEEEHLRVARRSCFYAMLLAFFFLFFGKLILWVFGVPLSMVRIVGGIILMRIGFDLFSPSPSSASLTSAGSAGADEDVSFVPLAMPIMFGPGAIATILGMVSLVKHSEFELVSATAVCVAIVATMFVTYLCLASAKTVLSRIGPRGIDAVTRIVGFFVSTMGMGLIFHGVIEAIQTYGTTAAGPAA